MQYTLDRRTKRYCYMICFMITAIILMGAIVIGKYMGSFNSNMSYAAIQALWYITLIIYGLSLFKSLWLVCLIGIANIFTGNTLTGEIQLLCGLAGLMVYCIRFIYRRNKGYIEVPNSIKGRLQCLFNSDIDVLGLEPIYSAILTVLILTIIIQTKNNYLNSDIEYMTVDAAWQLSLVLYAGIFPFLFMAANARGAYLLAFTKCAVFIVYLIKGYLANVSNLTYMYQIVEYFIEMLVVIVAIWYSYVAKDKEKNIG